MKWHLVLLSTMTVLRGNSAAPGCLEGCQVDDSGNLNLSFCEITDDIAAGLAGCLDSAGRANVRTLTLSDNQLTTLPIGVFDQLSSLTILSLGSNQLTNLPTGLFDQLESLEQLYLDDNELTTLPTGVFDLLASLERLVLDENNLTSLSSGVFDQLASLERLYLSDNELTTLPSGVFDELSILRSLYLDGNQLITLTSGVFDMLSSLAFLYLDGNQLTTLTSGVFDQLSTLETLNLGSNQLTDLPMGLFDELQSLEDLNLGSNQLTNLPTGLFDELQSLEDLDLDDNDLTNLPTGVFVQLAILRSLDLSANELTTLPLGVFDQLPSLRYLYVYDNALECLPSIRDEAVVYPSGVFSGQCGCTLADDSDPCGDDVCTAGETGYTCAATPTPCETSDDCDMASAEICCPVKKVCEVPTSTTSDACGDPHMTGFLGQKFDFVGQDGAWYAVISDLSDPGLPSTHINMRVSAPVPEVPQITYITGLSIMTTDADGLKHSMVIRVANPQSLESACPELLTARCLADGALIVEIDGQENLTAPGAIEVAPGVAIAAVNLPGACRSFGFEKYWESKKAQYAEAGSRKLVDSKRLQDMALWILDDPTATNMVECAEYVALATASGGGGLFAHDSEHTSFQIVTPGAVIRLSHGRLHQLPMRDPTDEFDLPDHLTWQMNIGIQQNDMSLDASGILGETRMAVIDDNGKAIMQGIESIRGRQEDYRVDGPLGVIFNQGQHHE